MKTHASLCCSMLPAIAALLSATVAISASSQANAQDTPRRKSASALLEEVVVTARKREEGSQQVPMAISAFGEEQIDALKVRSLTNLSVSMPNVAMDDIGTTPGTANFSIRGLGINSSIPSIDPTVGLFIDGVYLGTNFGVVFDMFDLESIEVLRGPQGILFGRNVTGGAVLLNTKNPPREFDANVSAAVDGGGDGGLTTYVMGSVGGPLSDTVGAKIAAYHSDDQGWFENEATGNDIGAMEQTMIRPIVRWEPSDRSELIVRYEYTKIDGDGPVGQNHVNGAGIPGAFASFDRDSHNVSLDEPGYTDVETNFFTAELNVGVDFGNGTITNIFGWRDYESENLADIDSQPVWLFHAPSWLEIEQFSNELRYNGLFGDRANVTTGLYYFTNEVAYHERRDLLGIATGGIAPAATLDGGGLYEVETYGLFAAVDYDLNESFTLSAGIRYTYEEKQADVVSLSLSALIPGTCNIVLDNDCPFDFNDDADWDSWSPKLGLTWHLSDRARLYTHWVRGFRSGGYNLRNTSFNPADTPGPFDQETVDNFEVGLKSEFGRGRLNAAVFFNTIDDMQRELNLPDQGAGVVQLIRNTADAEIFGVELDGAFSLSDSVLLTASLGWLDAYYTDVSEDLNNDGVVNGDDEDLELPRAADLTWSVGLNHDMDVGDWGYVSSRVSYSYRDDFAWTDSNDGFILDQERLDAGIDLHTSDGRWVFSLYGRNLLNDVLHGGDTQLPAQIGGVPAGGTFSPLAKGRVYGAEFTWNYAP